MEILVLLGLGICIFIMLPQYIWAKRQTQMQQEKNYIFRKLGLAVSHYQETYRSLPPSLKSPTKKPTSPKAD